MPSLVANPEDLLAKVERHVGEELLVVTYKWLSRRYCVNAELAKRTLHDFSAKHTDRVNVVYLLGGWTKESKSHVFQLTPDAEVEARRSLLDPVTSLHVYSVAPKQKTQTLVDLWAVNHDQTRELYKRMMDGDDSEQVSCLSHNTCGEISFDGVERIVKPKPVAVQPPAPAEENVEEPEETKSGALQKAPAVISKPKTKQGKRNLMNAFAKKAESKSHKAEEPTVSASLEEKNSFMVDAEDALKNARDDMDDSEDDDIVFRQRSSTIAGRSSRMQLDDDDDDDDDDDGEDGEPEPSRVMAADEVDEKGDFYLTQRVGSLSLTQQENGTDESCKGNNSAEENQQDMNALNVGDSAPATSGKIVTRKKVVKVYYDDNGCEATEEVWEDVVQDVKADAVVPPSQPSTQTAKRKSKSQESEPSAKRPRGGKVKSGSQRSIMSFFGRK